MPRTVSDPARFRAGNFPARSANSTATMHQGIHGTDCAGLGPSVYCTGYVGVCTRCRCPGRQSVAAPLRQGSRARCQSAIPARRSARQVTSYSANTQATLGRCVVLGWGQGGLYAAFLHRGNHQNLEEHSDLGRRQLGAGAPESRILGRSSARSRHARSMLGHTGKRRGRFPEGRAAFVSGRPRSFGRGPLRSAGPAPGNRQRRGGRFSTRLDHVPGLHIPSGPEPDLGSSSGHAAFRNANPARAGPRCDSKSNAQSIDASTGAARQMDGITELSQGHAGAGAGMDTCAPPGAFPTHDKPDLPRFPGNSPPARTQGRKREHDDVGGGDMQVAPTQGVRVAPALRPPAAAASSTAPAGMDALTMAAIQAAVAAAVTPLTAQITSLRSEVATIRAMEEDVVGDFGMEDVVAGGTQVAAGSGHQSAFPRALGMGAA